MGSHLYVNHRKGFCTAGGALVGLEMTMGQIERKPDTQQNQFGCKIKPTPGSTGEFLNPNPNSTGFGCPSVCIWANPLHQKVTNQIPVLTPLYQID
jgi:hypothetical protein